MFRTSFVAALSIASLLGIAQFSWADEAPAAANVHAAASTEKKLTDYTSFDLGEGTTGRFNALIQGWAVQNQNSTANDQNWRLRRSEMKLSGQIAHAPRYFFMVDPAKLIAPPGGKAPSADRMVQDFGLSYSPIAGLEITVGQFKIPTTAEGLDSSAELPLPERSVVGRAFGDRREMGVKVAYRTEDWNVASMLSSGRAIQEKGQGMFHDLDTRVEMTPVKGVGIGGFLALGNDIDYSKKGRFGFNGRAHLDNGIGLRAEVGFGKDNAIESRGYTTEVSYNLTSNLQPVFRYEAFKPNTAGSFTGQAESLGVNWFLPDYYSKVQLSGSMMQNMSAVNGSPTLVQGVNNADITLALQTSI